MVSPCVARCGLNDDNFCMGCYRHLDEIVGWGQSSEVQQNHIISQLEDRKSRFKDEANQQVLSRSKWLEAEARIEFSLEKKDS